MRNYIKLVASASLMCTAILPQTAQARPAWQDALVDAAGCLGLAEFGPVGCALGAAAATLAIVKPGPQLDVVGNVWEPFGQDGGCTDVNFPPSVGCASVRPAVGVKPVPITDETVGYWHNRIVRAYMAENTVYNRDALLRIALRETGMARSMVRNPALAEQLNKAISSGEEKAASAARYLDGPRPGGGGGPFGNLTVQKDVFDLLTSARTDLEVYNGVNILAGRKLNEAKTDLDRTEVRKYFSVLRSSIAYWTVAESVAFGNCMTEPTRCGTLPALRSAK